MPSSNQDLNWNMNDEGTDDDCQLTVTVCLLMILTVHLLNIVLHTEATVILPKTERDTAKLDKQ